MLIFYIIFLCGIKRFWFLIIWYRQQDPLETSINPNPYSTFRGFVQNCILYKVSGNMIQLAFFTINFLHILHEPFLAIKWRYFVALKFFKSKCWIFLFFRSWFWLTTYSSCAFDGQSFLVVCQGVLFCFMGFFPRTRLDYIECNFLQFNGSKKISVINLILNNYMNNLRFIFKYLVFIFS